MNMNMNDYLNVAAYQGPVSEDSVQTNLDKVLEITELAEKLQVDILCFPETFLHGYFSSREEAMRHALDLNSVEFRAICNRFSSFEKTTVLLGVNEMVEDKIYNTVVAIEKGKCLGRYRKAYTYAPYDYYALGRDFPVFEKKGVKYGIIVCLDSVYREPAYLAALQGARVIFCPSFNRVQKETHMFHYLHRKSHFISRAFDNHCWFIVSDIIWDKGEEACPGCACILNDEGEMIAKADAFQEVLLSYPIPLARLKEQKKIRLLGNPELFEMMSVAYKKALAEA
ncbi:N-carbamoyl-D-amino acid hydrolase [Aquicella siphonis]|uniref:N-carbamoyl-D-amino acid hydrolase n=1 Tax=Aquicella siphonis TaxID=254247 RepID=A0A5E4PGR3_9COXI|nr:carbon-nitrogen hydrolase family protein [Aquicella siphonis]VVC75647.1 N-carbamoyl-D-amino acid hydrolase [Aquicella siphonis]